MADITYIPTDESWLFGKTTNHSTKLANYASQVAGYLATIKDLQTCEIVGLAMNTQPYDENTGGGCIACGVLAQETKTWVDAPL